MSTSTLLPPPLSVPRVLAAGAALLAFWLAGCASDRLDPKAPPGVNLTGEWAFDPNLSDDPDKMGDADQSQQQKRTPGSHRGHGGRGGSGMPPMGGGGPGANLTSDDRGGHGSLINAGMSGSVDGGYEILPVASSDPPSGSGDSPAGAGPPGSSGPPSANGARTAGHGASISRALRPPVRLSITQKDSTLILKSNMPDGTRTVDEFAPGKSTIPFGQDEIAERTVGWRGPVFVVTLKARTAGWREDEFALDEDGRLIMTTSTRGGRLGKFDLTRVYDRITGAGATN